MATVFVAAAAVVYGLWQSGSAMTEMSVRAMAVSVFALGFLACTSDAKRMSSVYTPGAGDRPSTVYTVLASLLGFGALISGVWAIVAASETMLAILIGTMVALWLVTTVRHAITEMPRPHVTGPRAHAA
jgi:predicted ABC-type exoprotein transport system permease subunit